MRNEGTLLLIQDRLVQNGGIHFLIRKRLSQSGRNPFLIQNRLMPNGQNLFLNQKRPILLVRQGRIAYAPRVPCDRLYDFCEATYKTHILMPLIQNPPNKRFGLSRSWTQKRPMQNRENSFLIQNRLMPNGQNLFLNQKRPILLVRQGRIAYAPHVPGDRLYDFCEVTYKAHILMPLIQNPPNKRFGLSRYWTQKRSMPNGMNLFSIQNRFMQNGGNLFLTQKRLVQNGSILFSIRKRLMRNEMNLFLTQKRLVQNEGNGYGVKKWRLYLYWYPIWRTASSTAD